MAARTIASNSAVAVEDGGDLDLDLSSRWCRFWFGWQRECGRIHWQCRKWGRWRELGSGWRGFGITIRLKRWRRRRRPWLLFATNSRSTAFTGMGNSFAISHASAGSYESAFRLLHDQIGVVNFAPFKYVYCKVFVCKQTVYCSIPIIRPLFTAAFAKARTMFAGLPNLPSLAAYPQRNWREAAASSKVHGLPALGVRLADVAERLQVGWEFK